MTKLKTILLCIALSGVAACSGDKSNPAPTAKKPTEAALPAECTAYLALMNKLASCDKLDRIRRDDLKFAADGAPEVWANRPASLRAELGPQCAADAEKLADDAKTCGL